MPSPPDPATLPSFERELQHSRTAAYALGQRVMVGSMTLNWSRRQTPGDARLHRPVEGLRPMSLCPASR